MKNILIFYKYYLPSKLAGGPITSLKSIFLHYNTYNFTLYCSNKDLKSRKPYSKLDINKIKSQDNLKINHCNYFKFILCLFSNLFRNRKKIVYFNSFFCLYYTIIPLIIFKLFCNYKIILAPRGELCFGAFKIKQNKKFIFLKILQYFNIYKGLRWHFTSLYEMNSTLFIISKYLSIKPSIHDIVIESNNVEKPEFINKTKASKDILKLCFVSRIVPKKNLFFLIKTMQELNIEYLLNIYGPNEDRVYFNKCFHFARENNLNINYCGTIDSDLVRKTFTDHDLFLFPTFGENFGHVIYESLSVGTPVLTSSNTPWLHDGISLFCLPLDIKTWTSSIINFSNLTDNDVLTARNGAFEIASNYYKNTKINSNLFN